MQSQQFQLHAEIEHDHWWFVARRQIMRRLVREVLPPGENHRIVDVGCGTGANIAALAGEYRCLGIDTSVEGIELAQGRFPDVEFRCGLAPDDVQDIMSEVRLVTMMDVLEHVEDDFALLGNMLAATEPGTYFLITVPADESLWSPHDEAFGHFRRYDAERLYQLWVGLPVSTRMISYYNSRLYPVVKAIRHRNARRDETRGAVGTDFSRPIAPLNAALRHIFAGEGRVLSDLAAGRRSTGYRRGVSLIALVRREPGPIRPRHKPVELESLDHDPHVQQLAEAVV